MLEIAPRCGVLKRAYSIGRAVSGNRDLIRTRLFSNVSSLVRDFFATEIRRLSDPIPVLESEIVTPDEEISWKGVNQRAHTLRAFHQLRNPNLRASNIQSESCVAAPSG